MRFVTIKIRSLLIKAGKVILPHGIFIILRNARDVKKSYGNNLKSYCPICQRTGFFLPNGVPRRPKVKCTQCGSGERQRLMWLKEETKTWGFMETKIYFCTK